ncbi:MAG: TM0106 family RecB-like putative nuclease [Theionarchaea archaeon]|nr:TM0106 family RecB-like putative nuclease [Theionarchaea archaeon]
MGLETSTIEQVFEIYMDPCRRSLITDRTIYYKDVSDFMVYCERFGSEDKKDSLTEYQNMVFEQSQIHRQSVIESMYGRPEIREYDSKENGFSILLDRMSKGTDVLCDMPAFYMPENLSVVFDILEKRDTHKSVFGDYHYIVKKVVTAKEKNIDDTHRHRGGFQNYVLGKIQKYTPPQFYLVDRDHNEIPVDYDQCKNDLAQMLREIRDIFVGSEVPPTFGACEWPWEAFNNERARQLHDVSLVSGIGKSKKKALAKKGIHTVGDLAGANPVFLSSIKGISLGTAKRLIQKAQAICQGTIICLKPSVFPTKDVEIFLDFEDITELLYFGNPLTIDYLIGVVVRTEKTEYIPFLAHGLNGEREMFNQFIDWLLKQEDYIIYYFSPHDIIHLENLMNRYELSDKDRRVILSNMHDVKQTCGANCIFPTYRDDLKSLAGFFCYRWKHADVNANECTALYLQYVEDPCRNDYKLQKILDYNEDDCRALMHLKDQLEKVCQEKGKIQE